MGPCSKCQYFRRVKPVSQLLSAVLGGVMAGAEVTNALAKIVEDEQKVRDGEADIKGKEGAADRSIWPGRPMMSDYCGLSEGNETYFMCEVKNRGQECTDFVAGQTDRHACLDCSHHIPAQGSLLDQKMEATYNRLVLNAIAVQSSPQSPQSQLQAHRSGILARKALEIGGAYAAKGRMLAKPSYLDYCSQFSSEEEYVLCLFQNPHHTCRAWAGATGPQAGSGSAQN